MIRWTGSNLDEVRAFLVTAFGHEFPSDWLEVGLFDRLYVMGNNKVVEVCVGEGIAWLDGTVELVTA